jgi:hypothetical protein
VLGEPGDWPVPGWRGGGVDFGFGFDGEDGGFFGGGGVVCVGGGVDFVVVGVLGHVSEMLTTPSGSFSVDGETPGGSWK